MQLFRLMVTLRSSIIHLNFSLRHAQPIMEKNILEKYSIRFSLKGYCNKCDIFVKNITFNSYFIMVYIVGCNSWMMADSYEITANHSFPFWSVQMSKGVPSHSPSIGCFDQWEDFNFTKSTRTQPVILFPF